MRNDARFAAPVLAAALAAFDPERASVETIVAEVNRRLARRGLAVASLRAGGAGKAMRPD